MALKYNPFTGSFDQVGSGGGGSSYIDGEVATYADLPVTVGTPAVDSAYLVRTASGSWGGLVNRRPAGIYVRTANAGALSDWTYASAFPDVFNDANFLLYDNADSSKNLQFQLSGISTGTTRTLTAPDASGTIATEEGVKSLPAGSLWDDVRNQDGATAADGILQINNAALFGAQISAQGITASRTYTLPDASGTIMLGSLNLASLTNTATARTNLGLGSGDSPTFTNLTLSRGTITTSSPFALTQTWNAGAVAFTALDINVTNTASASTSALADFRVGGTRQAAVGRAGELLWNTTNTPALVPVANGFNFRLFTSSNIVSFGNPWCALPDVGYLGFSNAGDPSNNGNHDTRLYRGGVGILAVYNGTNAMGLRVFGTRTDASNGRWLSISSTTAGVFSITPTGNGTGASGNVLHISGLPTSNPGPGILWNNAGSVAIGT